MNRSIFWRIVWKEYRLQRALWIAMAFLTLLIMGSVVTLAEGANDKTQTLFLIAACLPACYALGCGAMLFAGEHELGTYEFQRTYPVRATLVGCGKVAFGLTSIAAMFVTTVLLALAMNEWKLPEGLHEDLTSWSLPWPVFGVFAFGVFGTAALFSAWLKRVLMAAILGVFTFSLVAQIVACLIAGDNWYWDREQWAGLAVFLLAVVLWTTFFYLLLKQWLAAMFVGIPVAIVGSFLLAATVAGIPYNIRGEQFVAVGLILGVPLLANAWVLERRFLQRRMQAILAASHAKGKALLKTEARSDGASDGWRIFGRLVWLHWRQSCYMVTTMTALLAGLTIFIAWMDGGRLFGRGYPVNGDAQALAVLAFYLVLMGVPILGTCAFAGDQHRRSYRFLADRGVPPKLVWLSRQVIAVLIPGVVIGTILLLFSLLLAMIDSQFAAVAMTEVGVVNILVHSFAFLAISLLAGQFCSMFLRSSFLAGFFSIPLAVFLTGWCVLMSYWHISWLWSVIPIPIVLLVATRVRTADWLVERNTIRAWLKPLAVVILPMIAVLLAVPLYRVYQIPAVGLGLLLSDYTRPMTEEEKATFDLYVEANGHFVERKANEEPPEEPSRGERIQSSEAAGVEGMVSDASSAVNDEDEVPDSSRPASQEAAVVAPSKSAAGAASVIHPAGKEKPASDDAEKLTPNDIAWLDANQETIALAIKASRGKLFVPVSENPPKLPEYWRLYTLLAKSAMRLESEGKLDDALECRLANVRMSGEFENNLRWSSGSIASYADLAHWAAKPNQTPERILAALHALEQCKVTVPRHHVVQDYVSLRAALSSVKGFSQSKMYDARKRIPMTTTIWLHLPWERLRALRLLDCLICSDLAMLYEFGDYSVGTDVRPTRGQQQWWQQQEDLPWAIQKGINVPPLNSCEYIGWYLALETKRHYVVRLAVHRSTCTALALAAWRLQHGALPKTADELLDACNKKLPIDPYSGEPFQYFPDGLPVTLQPRASASCFYVDPILRRQIPAATPLLWSPGQYVLFNRPTGLDANAGEKHKIDPAHCRIYTREGWDRSPQSELELWNAGWAIPIPMPPMASETKMP